MPKFEEYVNTRTDEQKETDKNIRAYHDLYRKRYRKKYSDKPLDVQIQARATFSTAAVVLAFLKDIPYETLISSMYVYCKDSNLLWLTREYEKQIELAGANPKRFVFQIHKFFNDVSVKIRKQNLYFEIVDYLGMYIELAFTSPPEVNRNVVKAYRHLLVRTTDYLRPNKYDFKQRIIGVQSNGQPLYIPNAFPFSHISVYETNDAIDSGKLTPETALDTFIRIYAKYGILIQSSLDMILYDQYEKFYTHTIAALMPYINEFTCDILPIDHYKSTGAPCENVNTAVSLDELLISLKTRKRTLPANGTKIVFEDSAGEILELFLKETVKNNAVIMLYRLTTSAGDLSGYFNTKSGFLYSIILESETPDLYRSIKQFILYCYAACVTNQVSTDKYVIHNEDRSIPFKIYDIGGKLRTVYNPGDAGAGTMRKVNPDFETKTVPVSENIRKLPIGQKASEQAVLLARQWGFDLDPGETFVRPFCKEVFVRRQD